MSAVEPESAGQAAGPASGLGRALLDCADLPVSVLLASFFVNLLGLALPLAMLQIYDRILPNQSTDTLLFLCIGLLVVVLMEALMKLIRSYVMGWSAVCAGFRMEMGAVTRFLKATPASVNSEPPGIWIDSLEALGRLNAFHGGSSRLVLVDLPFTVLFLIVTILVGGTLALVPIALMLIFGASAVFKGYALSSILARRADQDNKRYDFLTECLAGLHTIKGLAIEPQMQRRFERLQKGTALASYDTIAFGNNLQTQGNLFANLTMISVVTVGAMMVMDGRLSIGELACCTLLSGRLTQPILRGIGLWSELQNVALAKQRTAMFDRLQITAGSFAAPALDIRGEIVFDEVSHWFDTPNSPRLRDISLQVRPGEFIGIGGADGSGRSTLAGLILGDLEPISGSVRIDRIDASGPNKRALRRCISHVASSPTVFQGTILENLTMFQMGERVDAARQAAQLIGLEDDIHRLPYGYDTPLAQGVAEALSAGLLQRITIARALAAEPKVLIFDEANTLLDYRSDGLLRDGLRQLRGHVTTLFVSSRPSLLGLADRIFELQNGGLHPLDLASSNLPSGDGSRPPQGATA
ncbi:MAG: peptidase domain-containing ABC transporter [Methyloligellaceae bacterium]